MILPYYSIDVYNVVVVVYAGLRCDVSGKNPLIGSCDEKYPFSIFDRKTIPMGGGQTGGGKREFPLSICPKCHTSGLRRKYLRTKVLSKVRCTFVRKYESTKVLSKVLSKYFVLSYESTLYESTTYVYV